MAMVIWANTVRIMLVSHMLIILPTMLMHAHATLMTEAAYHEAMLLILLYLVTCDDPAMMSIAPV